MQSLKTNAETNCGDSGGIFCVCLHGGIIGERIGVAPQLVAYLIFRGFIWCMGLMCEMHPRTIEMFA